MISDLHQERGWRRLPHRVLILVLMEDRIGDNGYEGLHPHWMEVLILVMMEYGLGLFE